MFAPGEAMLNNLTAYYCYHTPQQPVQNFSVQGVSFTCTVFRLAQRLHGVGLVDIIRPAVEGIFWGNERALVLRRPLLHS